MTLAQVDDRLDRFLDSRAADLAAVPFHILLIVVLAFVLRSTAPPTGPCRSS